MKQECTVSNEHEAARSYTEDLILKDLMEQTYSLIFKAVPTTTTTTASNQATFIHFFSF